MCVGVFDLFVRWRHAHHRVLYVGLKVRLKVALDLQTAVSVFETNDSQIFSNVRFRYKRCSCSRNVRFRYE